MAYNEYKNLNYAEVASEVLQYWQKENIFNRSIEEKEGAPSFTFFEGPPSANGTPGIHHVMARTIKDVFCRYKTMQGFQVKRKGGWDTHGLPVELQVEKELGITKEDIGKKISVEDYNQKCRSTVMKFKGEWDELTKLMGYWVDLDNPYITYENKYIESCWALLKRLHDKDLLYKGFTIQPYSPAAGTGLSSHELNQPGCYRMVKDTSIVAQFKVIKNAASAKLFQNIGSSIQPLSHRDLLKSINDPESTQTVKEVVWDQVYFLAWTTTPWTLPSNAALAVGEKIRYVKVKTFNPYTYLPVVVILAEALLPKFFHEKAKEITLESFKPGDKIVPYLVMEAYTGAELLDLEYEQLMPYVQPDVPAFRVISGDFVSTEDGTGIVHIAPTFGADDYRVAKQVGIPAITVLDDLGQVMPLVDKRGRFVSQVTDYAGFYVKNYEDKDESAPDYKSTDVLISIQLKTENKAFKVEKYEHSYPHCWRTDKPILYYPMESWFIKTTAYKDRMVELNKTIQWKPESTGTGRFGNWLENLVDWNLSRSRYWGTPLPIWVSEDKKEIKCIGSLEDLKKEIEKAQKAGIETINPFTSETELDLHRPYVDRIVLVSDAGKPMYREADLVDVWFDSGAMPYAQWHYPFENQEIFQQSFPADFISEGVDQTRGWFFTLHALSVMLFDQVAFKNVVSTGLVLDKNGEKMSKRKGNVINPFDTLQTYGPDATRWYMIANAPPWDNLKFNLEGVGEVQRKFFGTLQNTYSFFALYANLDHFVPQNPLNAKTLSLTESDLWVLSKLQTVVQEVEKALDDYEPTKAARSIQDFVCDDLSNWYVRLNRKRFWKGALNEDKRAAYQTLYTCLETIAKLMAPISPFYAEKLFQDLTQQNTLSVHLVDFPKADLTLSHTELEQQMSLAQVVCSLVHAIRKVNYLRVRQPLQQVLIPVTALANAENISKVEAIILHETNVKKLVLLEDTHGFVTKKAKPNFQTLGKKFGPVLKDIGAFIASMSQAQISDTEKGKALIIPTSQGDISLSQEDLLIETEDVQGWKTASDKGITVALDVTITEELKQEGIARDFVNRIQNMRKDSGMEVTDKIHIWVEQKDALIEAALLANREYICQETQAKTLEFAEHIAHAQTVSMEDFELNIKIEK